MSMDLIEGRPRIMGPLEVGEPTGKLVTLSCHELRGACIGENVPERVVEVRKYLLEVIERGFCLLQIYFRV